MQDTIPGLPIPPAALKALFDHLDRPNPDPCSHTFKETIEFLEFRGLPVESMLIWLGQNGAGCDCEVIYNTENDWGEAVGRFPASPDDV
jgi:hypothetical protein